jgi:glycerol-3-phosphate dehydrogenase (NAD(P)+)
MKISVLGSGPLGIGLSINFSKNDSIDQVLIYSRKSEIISQINHDHRCIFDDIELSSKICATGDLFFAIDSSDIIFITVNSSGLLNFLLEITALKGNFDLSKKFFIICTKGIDREGFFSDIAKKILGTDGIAFLFGPSFAHEIACGERTFVNLIYHDLDYASNIINQIVCNETNVKLFPIIDYIGAQVCSVMKNICAIYLGMAKGFGIKNDRIAVMFKFFVDEMLKVINFYKGDEKTIFEFCGIGDLFLTCTSFESRNCNFGYQVGLTKNVDLAYQACNNYYPEGYYSLKNLIEMNKKSNLKLTICEKIYKVLFIDKCLHENKDIFEL